VQVILARAIKKERSINREKKERDRERVRKREREREREINM
jgi:hypothetical protein